MRHLDSWMKRDQLDVTCFIISLFNAQHVSDVNTSILRNLRLICWVISWVVLLWFDVCWCYGVVWLGWCGTRMQADTTPPQPNHNVAPTHIEPEQYNPWNNSANKSKLLRMDVLTSETCWVLNNEILMQMTSSWSLFIQQSIDYLRNPEDAWLHNPAAKDTKLLRKVRELFVIGQGLMSQKTQHILHPNRRKSVKHCNFSLPSIKLTHTFMQSVA